MMAYSKTGLHNVYPNQKVQKSISDFPNVFIIAQNVSMVLSLFAQLLTLITCACNSRQGPDVLPGKSAF